MTEQEQQAIRATVLEATTRGFDKGIRTAADVVRVSANLRQFLNLLKLHPQTALNELATVIDDIANNNNSRPLPEAGCDKASTSEDQ